MGREIGILSLVGFVALTLHDQHGAVRSRQTTHEIEPIGERAMLHGGPPVGELAGLPIGSPQQDEDRLALHEQSVRTVVDVLPAEVPQIEPHRFPIVRQIQMSELHAVRGRHRGIESQSLQPPTHLSLADAAISENADFQLGVSRLPQSSIPVMRANRFNDILILVFPADFGGKIFKRTVVQTQRLKSIEQRNQWSEVFETFAPTEIERLKLQQTGQSGDVAQTEAITEIEPLKLRQASQPGHVAQTDALTEIDPLKLRQAVKPEHVAQTSALA